MREDLGDAPPPGAVFQVSKNSGADPGPGVARVEKDGDLGGVGERGVRGVRAEEAEPDQRAPGDDEHDPYTMNGE